LSNSAAGPNRFGRFDLDLNSFTQIIGRIHNHLAVLSQAVQHLQVPPKIATYLNCLPMDAIVLSMAATCGPSVRNTNVFAGTTIGAFSGININFTCPYMPA
jgi:hypothetical protein